MMRNILLMTVMAFSLTACIFDDDKVEVWSRKGKTSAQAKQQVKACQQFILKNKVAEKKQPTLFKKCMSEKGYQYGVPRK